MHSESFRLLPWHVKGQLDPERSRQVDMHLQGCLACRREAEGLTQLFCAHSQLNKPRPVDEARLDALFAKIDRYEESRRPQPPRARAASSMLSRLREVLMGWFFDTRLMLAAGGACAAALLAIIIGPMVSSPDVGIQHQVLSSPTQGADELRVKLQVRSATSQADVERIVATTLTERKLQIQYRIERRSAGEYALIFARKPDFAALSELLGAWSSAPGIASASIDDTAAGR
jgi:anti-sigma factor RsiW